ncbi:MAG TPA: putative LPS assembly protein LptD [Gemmatimonadaceae bacterium]|nr:putative LPS assembly protein LptD [Gemmatimonadaceae bacterium]
MRVARAAVVTAFLVAAAITSVRDAAGQVRDTLQARRDSVLRDSLGQPLHPAADTTGRELVTWVPEDSVMAALMRRPGYTVTRYQGRTVVFDPVQREIRLLEGAAIQREATILVGDSVSLNDSTRTMIAWGLPAVLRDPTQGTADLIAQGRLEYDMAAREGLVTGLCTSMEETGVRWFVCGDQSGFRLDSASGDPNRRTFYAHSGRLTSCDLAVPHYHFRTGEVKVIQRRILVARSATMYVSDVPVFWLPFIFQDMRSGRRSGLLSPRLGFSDILRNSSGYRRQIENLGWYFALSDYMDAQLSFDWRSGARSTDQDPGWKRWNGEWRYRWLDRFLSGRVALSHEDWDNGQTNSKVSWSHAQDFSMRSKLNTNINYVTSTQLQSRQAFNVAAALATIASQVSFQQGLGPANVSIGGSRTQYPGRDQVQQNFPNVTLTTKPVEIAEWLVWSPGLSATNNETFNFDGGGTQLAFRYFQRPDGAIDSLRLDRDQRTSGLRLDTPFRIFGFEWRNSVNVQDTEVDFPQAFTIFPDVNDTSRSVRRVYERTYRTDINWETGISLPTMFRSTLNLTPTVGIVNVDRSAPFMLRTQLSGDEYIRQGKRLEYGASISPTLFAFFPAIGPFSRIRHAFSPRISYSYAPEGDVSDEFLAALNRTRPGYLGDLRQNMLTFGLSQVFEAKLESPADSVPGTGEKIKLLQLDFSSVAYDFERKRAGASGITTSSFSVSGRSDLLPGMSARVGYSLFEGNPVSDTARFDPYRTDISIDMSIGADNHPFSALTRIFGQAVPPTADDTLAGLADVDSAGQPSALAQGAQIAGTSGSRNPMGINVGRGWQASLQFSTRRSRPVRGDNVEIFDPEVQCARFSQDPILFRRCQDLALSARDSALQTIEGGVVTQFPPTSTLRGNFTFNLTPRWAVQWGTGYDFERSEFADHTVTLQRELHDWRAIFAFTQAPNGNFAFNFFIALKAAPDIRFDYNRRTYRPGG